MHRRTFRISPCRWDVTKLRSVELFSGECLAKPRPNWPKSSLDVGSAVRRREVWDETILSHEDVTEQVLTKLLDRAAGEAR